MLLPDLEGGRSSARNEGEKEQKKDSRPIFAPKEETPEQKLIRERRFTPQPSAGIDLSVMDPLPNLPDHEVSDAEPE